MDINILPGILSVLIFVAILFLCQNRNWKIILFGLLWFGVFLVPTFVYHTDKVEYHIPYYEHRIYVPMIGIVLILSSLVLSKKMAFLKRLIPLFLCAVIAFLGFKSYHQTYYFQNYFTLRQYAAERSPHDKWLYSEIGRMNLPESLKKIIQNYKMPSDVPAIDAQASDSLKKCRRTRDILVTLEKKLITEPENKDLQHDLAIVNYARGYVLRAEKLFLSAKNLDPNNPNIPYNLGILYYDAHRYKQSEQEWLSAVKLDTMFGNAYLNLTYLYYENNQCDRAWEKCQLALKTGMDVPENLVQEILNNVRSRNKVNQTELPNN